MKNETKFVPYSDTTVKNFSIHKYLKSQVKVYDKSVIGCQSANADFMLTFGSTIDVLDGNNKVIHSENPKHVDIFLNKEQVQKLYVQLKSYLEKS